jgi:hypothetical protein
VLIGTARIGSAAQTEFVSKEDNPGSFSNVQTGDVLVSHSTAVREHEMSIVPNAPHAISPTHDAAVSDGRSEADAIGVDAWLTEDQTHVVKIASNRTPPSNRVQTIFTRSAASTARANVECGEKQPGRSRNETMRVCRKVANGASSSRAPSSADASGPCARA